MMKNTNNIIINIIFISTMIFALMFIFIFGCLNAIEITNIVYDILLSIITGILASYLVYIYGNKLQEFERNLMLNISKISKVETGIGNLYSSLINVADYEFSRFETDKIAYDRCMKQLGNSIVGFRTSIKYGRDILNNNDYEKMNNEIGDKVCEQFGYISDAKSLYILCKNNLDLLEKWYNFIIEEEKKLLNK